MHSLTTNTWDLEKKLNIDIKEMILKYHPFLEFKNIISNM